MQFSREDLDRTLETVKTAVGALAARLLELDAERERRAPEAQGLAGTSAAAWRQGSETLVSMWVAYQELSEKVAAVEAERAAGPLSRDALTKIGSSLLTSSTQSKIAELSATLEQTAESMMAIWAARDLALTRLDEIEGRLARADSTARQAGTRMPNAAASLRDRLPELRRQVIGDPLSVPPEGLAALTIEAEQVCSEVDASAAHVEGAAADLDRLAAAAETARLTVDRARSDGAEAGQKIAGARSPAGLEELARRAEELRTEIAAAMAQLGTDRAGAARAAARLAVQVETLTTDADDAATVAAAPLLQRRELRGRLAAYRAKAVATGRAEDLHLEELYGSAEGALYEAPCDLEEAGRRVTAYQQGLTVLTDKERSE
jgi:hypothetical protein